MQEIRRLGPAAPPTFNNFSLQLHERSFRAARCGQVLCFSVRFRGCHSAWTRSLPLNRLFLTAVALAFRKTKLDWGIHTRGRGLKRRSAEASLATRRRSLCPTTLQRTGYKSAGGLTFGPVENSLPTAAGLQWRRVTAGLQEPGNCSWQSAAPQWHSWLWQ